MPNTLSNAHKEIDAFCKKYNISSTTHALITKHVTIEILNHQTNDITDLSLPDDYRQCFIEKIRTRTGILNSKQYRYNYTYYVLHHLHDIEVLYPELENNAAYSITIVAEDNTRLLYIYIPNNQHTPIQPHLYKRILKESGISKLFKALRSTGTVIPINYKQYTPSKIESNTKLVVGVSSLGTLNISYISAKNRSIGTIK